MDIIDTIWGALYLAGSAVCHQMPERSIFIGDYQLPVCARCTGIYIGACIVFLFLLAGRRMKGNKPPTTGQTIFLALCFLPFMLDGFFSYLGLWKTNNFLRLATGLSAGCSFPVFLVLADNFQVDGDNQRPILKNHWEIIFLFLCSFGIGLWIYYGKGIPGLAAGGLILIGMLYIWNTVAYLALSGFKKRCGDIERRILAAGVMILYLAAIVSIRHL